MAQENNKLIAKTGTWKAFSEKNNSICLADDNNNEDWYYISSGNKPLKDFVVLKYKDWKGSKIKVVLDNDRVIAIEQLPEPKKVNVGDVKVDEINILELAITCQWHAIEMLKEKDYEDVTKFLDDVVLLRNKLVADLVRTYTKKNGNRTA